MFKTISHTHSSDTNYIICLFVQSCTSSEEQEELDDSTISIEDVTSADYDVESEESTDSEQELQIKRHIELAEFVGEYEDDVELMQQMGLPLSFFNSPYDKTDKVLEWGTDSQHVGLYVL